MIKHHPSRAVLEAFVLGEQEASVSVIVASHVELCEECQAAVEEITASAALSIFDEHAERSYVASNLSDVKSSDQYEYVESDDTTFSDMLGAITQIDVNESHAVTTSSSPTQDRLQIETSAKSIAMPRAIRSINLKEWQRFGKVSRARFEFDDNECRMSLLSIDEGGSVPPHTHKGFEVTLLLDGQFDDEMGSYSKGDFIWLDRQHTHTPRTKEGCVCLTVSSDALHFTQGVSQLLNPLGKFMY